MIAMPIKGITTPRKRMNGLIVSELMQEAKKGQWWSKRVLSGSGE